MNYGFVASKIDGSEQEFNEFKDFDIPKEYSYKKFLPDVINQGQKPICVPCSVSAYINWNKNLSDGDNHRDNKVDLMQIFNNRTNESNDGMSFKDAFYFLRHEGVKTESGIYKINRYAKIPSELALKQALPNKGRIIANMELYGFTMRTLARTKR